MPVRDLGLLLSGGLGLWLLAAYPARILAGETALVHSATAVLLCLVPTSLTLIWSHAALRGSPEQQLAAIVGGTAVRIGFVVTGALLLYHTKELYHERSFWLWVIAAYLATLGVEVALVVGRLSRAEHFNSEGNAPHGGGQT